MQAFFPSLMVVVVSMGSLFIPMDQVSNMKKKLCFNIGLILYLSLIKIPGRMTLSITTCLTIVALSTNVFASSPRTSYMKIIDIWMITCFELTFTIVMVFCVITYIRLKVNVTNCIQGQYLTISYEIRRWLHQMSTRNQSNKMHN